MAEASTPEGPMPVLTRPTDEAARLAAVRRYQLLDTPSDGAFDRVTRLAAALFDVPIAIVSVVDHDRIWFKSRHGLDAEQLDRDPGLCASAILQDDVWVVEDARRDPRTLSNPLVAGSFGLQFYAGAPLRTADGHNLGTMCVIDREPRRFSAREAQILEDLAAIIIDELELRLAARELVAADEERTLLLDARQRQAVHLNDEVVQRLTLVKMSLDLGEQRGVREHIDEALAAGKRILGDLAADAPTLRRERAALDL